MIEYKDIVDKRVILVILDDANTATLVPGVAGLDEENFMFQIYPDEDLDDCIGLGCESFEDDIIQELETDHEFRIKYNCRYAIVLE